MVVVVATSMSTASKATATKNVDNRTAPDSISTNGVASISSTAPECIASLSTATKHIDNGSATCPTSSVTVSGSIGAGQCPGFSGLFYSSWWVYIICLGGGEGFVVIIGEASVYFCIEPRRANYHWRPF